MGVSKVILVDPNTQTPEVLMDVTGDDTSAGVLLAGNVGTRNDGEKVTGAIPAKTSSDLTVSGATVTAPAGHYASNASATVASGTAGTPTATKGSVSNHSVNVTPSVTNTSGYISGGTQTGTAVSVSANELVSGTKSITANGTGIDVTNYASVDVAVATEMPGLENALCFSSPSSFTLQIGTNGLTAAQVWNHMEWTDAATPQSEWTTWDGSTTLTASNGRLYLRGTGNTSITGYEFMQSIFIWFQFTGTDIECSGNIETLLDYETVAQGNHPTMDAGCYGYLFFNSPITTAPSLPATTLTEYCYYYMFCRTAITSAPSLPATTLANRCYSNMFYGCTALTSAPSLPATTLATYCYERMFYNCTALTSAPALPATTLAGRCYYYMFNGCTNLASAPALPATTLTTYCYSDMFHGCTALTSAPALPATTLATYCYYSMFYGCTALTSAPALPATTLTTYCYYSMFRGCTALTSAPALPATVLATYCYHSMFRGCTALTSVPVLPATALENYCYNNMFYDCSSIKLSTAYDPTNYPYAFRIPESGTGIDATGSLTGMFASTGGSFADTPTINTVYYLDKPLPVDFTVDGDATASDILPGKISYANGSRVVGNMASKSSSDLTVSGATVTAPAGYYSAEASKSVASGSAFAPASISGTSATVSTDTNTMTLTKSVSVTPIVSAGYVSAGTRTNSSISLTANVTTKEAATITPTTSNQTIAAGTYLTGAQTIAGNANLVAGNIKSGVSIFGVTGTFAGDATVYKDAWTSRGTLEKNTASLSLSQWRQRGAATSVGDYALFAGGQAANSTSGTTTVDIISKKLVHSTNGSQGLVSSTYGLAATTVGNYALFGGGNSTSVTAYSSTLTRTSVTSISNYVENLAATTVGSYALFGGGLYSYYGTVYATVDTYNTSLTKGTATTLSQARHRLSAAHIGNYALFAGGETSTNGGYVSTVDAYNTSLTRSTPTALSEVKSLAGATSVGNYALFGGGSNGSVRTNVNAYNTSLTRSTPTALSAARAELAATSTSGYAIFGGGYSLSAVVDAYNTSLTRSTPTAFSTARYYHSATAIGDIALFGLGYMSSSDSKGVEIYDVPYILTTTVPASYTYMFSDDTPVTVSTATSVTKNSITPISGIVCKAATTKTGQIT